MNVSIVCRVQKYQFLAAWRRRLRDFLDQDYIPEWWECAHWREYTENDFKYFRQGDLRRLDLSKLDRWVEQNRPRTTTCPQVLVCGDYPVSAWGRAWAVRTNHWLEPKGYQPMRVGHTWDDEDELISIPVVNRKLKIKHAVRDCQAVLLLTEAQTMTRDGHIAALYAHRLNRPCLQLHDNMDWRQSLASWLDQHAIERLNLVIDITSSDEASGRFVANICSYLERIGK